MSGRVVTAASVRWLAQTYPEQLAELRAAMPHAWLLIPGYGSQGGAAADVAAGFDAPGLAPL